MIHALMLLGCGGGSTTKQPEPAPHEEPHAEEQAKSAADKYKGLFEPLPAHMHKGEVPKDEVISLGRMLYYEPRLSKNHDIACNSCHKLDGFGVDNQPTSPGHKGQLGGRNSPTSMNAALHFAQFWDGRAADVEAQAKGPVLNPVEMAMASEEATVAVLKSIPGYQDAFKAAYGEDAVTYDNMANAIGAFERGLVTPSPFDAFLKGDDSALTDDQKAGLDLFVSTGCASCHNGVALGGNSYQKLGAVKPYETKDEGRKEVTGKDADKHFFKVPSLRNIDKTGPYFHDGSIATLDEAVKLMATHQLGKELSDEDTGKIVTFLGSLTGKVDETYVAKPELPESGPDTPKPDPT